MLVKYVYNYCWKHTRLRAAHGFKTGHVFNKSNCQLYSNRFHIIFFLSSCAAAQPNFLFPKYIIVMQSAYSILIVFVFDLGNFDTYNNNSNDHELPYLICRGLSLPILCSTTMAQCVHNWTACKECPKICEYDADMKTTYLCRMINLYRRNFDASLIRIDSLLIENNAVP